MTRIKAVIAAGTLTGIVLATAVGFGIGNLNANSNSQDGGSPATESDSAQPKVNLQVMLEREVQYRQQLEEANRTIEELRSQQPQRFFDDDGYEEHEEHEEYEEDDD